MMSGNPNIISSSMSMSTENGISIKEPNYTKDELPWGIEKTKKKSEDGCFLCRLCKGRTIGRILNIDTHVNGLKHLKNLKEFLINERDRLTIQIQQKENKKVNFNKQNLNSIPKLMSLNITSSKFNCGLNNEPNIIKNTPLNTSQLRQSQDESKLSSSFDVPSDESLSKYSEFIVENNSTDKFAYRCTLCYTKLKSDGSASNHLNNPQHIESLINDKLIKIARMVNKQPLREFKDNSWLPQNIYYHVTSDEYSCQLCESRFNNFSSINEHIYDCKRKKQRKVAELIKSNIVKYGIENVAVQQNNYTEETKVNIDNKNDENDVVKMDTANEKKPLTNSLSSNNYHEESLDSLNFPKWKSIEKSAGNINLNSSIHIAPNQINSIVNNEKRMTNYDSTETKDDNKSKEILSNEIKMLSQNCYQCKICLCKLYTLIDVSQHLKGQRHSTTKKKTLELKNEENKQHEENVEATKSNDKPSLNKPTEIKKNPIVNSQKDTASVLRHQKDFPNAINEINSSPDTNLFQQNKKIPTTTETSNDKMPKQSLSNEVKLLHLNRYECKICLCRLDGIKSVAQHLKGQRHFITKKKIRALKNKENEQHENNIEVKKSNDNPSSIKSIEIEKNSIVNNQKDTASALRHQYDFPNAIDEINSSFSSLNITPFDINNNTVQNYSKTNELRFKKLEDPRKAMMNAEDCEICHIKVPGGAKGLSDHRSTDEHINNMNKVFGFMNSSVKTIWSTTTTNQASTSTTVFNNSTGLNLNSAAWPTVIDTAKSRGTVNISELKSSNKIAEPKAKHSCHICGNKTVTQNDLHTHMSCHFVDRFVINSEIEVNYILKTENGIIKNLENNEEDLNENEEDLKKNEEEEITNMQSFLNDSLGIKPIIDLFYDVNNNNNSENESSINEDVDPSSNDTCDKDNRKQDKRNEKKLILKRKKIEDNVIYNGPSENSDIYEIDNDKIDNIKRGITLSITLDENNIWCFICNEKVKNSLQTFNEHIRSLLHECNYEKLMDQHKQYETFNDQLSSFDLAIQYIYEISDSTVQCLACDILIMNRNETIKNHIDKKNHQDKTNIFDKNKNNIYKSIHLINHPYFYNCQVYWCVICGTKFHNEIEFRRHLDQKKHHKKVDEYSQKLIFDYCPTCAVLWYGFPQTFSYHCEGKMHKYHKKDKHFFINELPSVINDMLANPDYYADELVSLIDNFAENERKKEKLVLKDLTNTVKNKYPQAQHYIFGSRLTGLALENSDIDVYLDCKHKKKSSYFGSSSIEVNEVIKEVEKCLINKKNDWLIKRVISNARVPIIKLVHRKTLMDCDISFSNGLAVEKSILVKIYCDKNSNCRKLILFIKKWFNYCDLTCISSNAVAWLVIYYLQVQSILPAVIELIEKKTVKRTVAGWEVGVGTDIFTFTEVKDFKKLLKDFFLFYAYFDYKNDIICPLLGKAVKKSLFFKPNELPVSMKQYVLQLERGHMLEVDCVMCIQDPFDLGHNMTDSVDKFNVYRLMTFCISSAKILEK